MQPMTRLPEELFNGGANDTQFNIARGLESVGVPQDIAGLLGHWYTCVFIVIAFLFLLRYFGWIGAKRRPAKKKRKNRQRR